MNPKDYQIVGEPRRTRYHWHIDGAPDARTVLIMEDGVYWKVVLLVTGEALMTAFYSSGTAGDWATARGYRVLQPI